MKLKRTVLTLLLAVAFLPALIACGGQSESPAPAPQPGEEAGAAWMDALLESYYLDPEARPTPI